MTAGRSEHRAAVRVRVPAKINLFLAVRGLRDDGYHEVVSVMQTVGLHDVVTARLEGPPVASQHPATRRSMRLSFEHDAGDRVPSDKSNLAVRAACALMRTVGIGVPEEPNRGSGADTDVSRTRLHLHKRIPVAAGMAGGSADAAGAIVALNQLWACELDRDEQRRVAAELGSDVPFCVTGGTALATGTGTATAQVLCRGRYHWVIGISDRPLATPDVYRTWDDIGCPSEIEPDAVLAALRTGDAEALGAALHNDLEPATFHLRPELLDARDAMLDAGALGAVVSGSGPTLVALAASEDEALDLAAALGEHFDRTEVAASPAGGPDLVRA